MLPMQVLRIEYDSPEYRKELALRNRLLRLPLGLDVFDEDLEVERDQWHYGLFEGGTLIGCVVAVPSEDGTVRIRQMAIDTDRQSTGCGRVLMEEVERNLMERGARHVTLHARVEAVGFYEKHGYTVSGDVFVEVGIAHRTMEKRLAAP